jgi:hypothetical protein
MPNWCSNRATISGPAPVIREITDILNQEDTPLLAWMVPEPKYEGDQDWYNWRVSNWGTKWDISDVYFEHQPEEDQSSSVLHRLGSLCGSLSYLGRRRWTSAVHPGILGTRHGLCRSCEL